MFQDADCLGPEFYEFQEDFFTIGELDNAVKAFDIKKILEVIGRINTQLAIRRPSASGLMSQTPTR